MKINDPETLAAVTAACDQYKAALMANDLATLDALFLGFADDPSLWSWWRISMARRRFRRSGEAGLAARRRARC